MIDNGLSSSALLGFVHGFRLDTHLKTNIFNRFATVVIIIWRRDCDLSCHVGLFATVAANNAMVANHPMRL